jgi:hypothetical protein
MRLAMQVLPLDGKPILSPLPLDVNQRALPLAKQQVLKRADRQELILGVHG